MQRKLHFFETERFKIRYDYRTLTIKHFSYVAT